MGDIQAEFLGSVRDLRTGSRKPAASVVREKDQASQDEESCCNQPRLDLPALLFLAPDRLPKTLLEC